MIEARPSRAARAALLAASLAALESGRFDEAESQAGALAADDAGDVDASLLQGLAQAARGESRRAAPLLQQVAARRPGFGHPCRDLARLLPDAAPMVAAQFRACRHLAPADRGLSLAYAEFLLDAGRPAPAGAVLRGMLRQSPRLAPAHLLLGMAWLDLGAPDRAIDAFRRATRFAPQDAAAWSNLGVALKIEGRFEEARLAHDRAAALAPADMQVRLNRAIALLRAGWMAQAWPDYESRLRLGPAPALPLDRLLPEGAALAGRTVLVWHEEGFGDTLHFARYLIALRAAGARVLARLPPALTRLLAPLAEIVPEGAALPAYDWHCPFFSLPRAFCTTLATIPAAIPYLAADPAEAAAMARHLPADGLRVGLVWAGQARPGLPGFRGLDARRSMALATLAPLAALAGISWVSLQQGPAAVQPAPPGMVLTDPMPLAHDFAATAAVIAGLDVVVGVDTAVIHLAAAMGKPVLLLDRYDACWRWFAGRDDSPWYPTLRILRQTQMGDWAPVIAAAAAALRQMAGHCPL